MADGGGRLLRQRSSHSEPPIKLRFHGNDGQVLLSAGVQHTHTHRQTRTHTHRSQELNDATTSRRCCVSCIGCLSVNDVACLVHQSLAGQTPAYIADDIQLVTDSDRRQLRLVRTTVFGFQLSLDFFGELENYTFLKTR